MRCSGQIAQAATTADHRPATAIPLTPARAAAARKQILDNHDPRFVIKCFSVTLSGHTSLLCDLLSACWRDLTPELQLWKLCSYSHLQHSDVLMSYRTQQDPACVPYRRRNHSYGFISIFTIITLLAHRQWFRQLRAICLSDASHAQLLGNMYCYY